MADEKDYYDAGNIVDDIKKIKHDQISYKKDLEKLSSQLSAIDRNVAELVLLGRNTSRINFSDTSDARSANHNFNDIQDKYRQSQRAKKSSFSTKSDNGDYAADDAWEAIKAALGLDNLKSRSGGSKLGRYLDKFESEFMSKMFNTKGLKTKLSDIMNRYADELGVSIEDIPDALGNGLANAIKNSKLTSGLGGAFSNVLKGYLGGLEKLGDSFFSEMHDYIDQGKFGQKSDTGSSSNENTKSKQTSKSADDFKRAANESKTPNGESDSKGFFGHVGDFFKNFTKGSKANSDSDGPGGLGGFIQKIMGGLGKSLTSLLGPILGPIATLGVVFAPIALLLEALEPILETLSALFGALGDAMGREEETRKKRQEYAQKRLKDDINAMVKAPFDILKAAADELYGTWKESIRTINATQGYTKEDLQNFMSTMARRIESEGYGQVISIADLNKDIAKVLDKGLTGKIGEEFAWMASKLNAAVPTQDFFSYADTYASLVANAQSAGMSQAAAIEHANKALENMASNLLYAGREISGGITIGLQSGADLFADSVKIAQAGRKSDNDTLAKITGTLTSASAIIGAIAPDLSKGIVDAITSAATGGNNETIVALRSLSNQNASNTEFLKKFIEDPQQIFSSIFTNLSSIFNESSDAYMEKAEAYANLFGMSAEAFQRVDFNQLAAAISTMNVQNRAYDQNTQLILAGQTKTTDEQMKIAQINKYMQEEGLAYVMDNEVAQMIQQHMWDEQLAREMQETTYGVELVGKTFSLLDAIVGFVERLVNLFNPFYWAKKVANVIQSGQETRAWESDISDMLEAVKVGQGNPADKYMLTNRNNSYNLIGGDNKYLSVLKQAGFSDKASNVASVTDTYRSAFSTLTLNINELVQAERQNTIATLSSTHATNTNSKSLYRWHLVTKAEAQAAAMALKKGAAESAKSMSDSLANYNSSLRKIEDENRQWLEGFEKKWVNPETTKDHIGSFFNGIFGRLGDAVKKFFETDIPTSAKKAAAEVKSDTRQSFTDFYSKLTNGMSLEQRHAMSTIWVKDTDADKDKNYDVYLADTLMQYAKDSSKTFEDWEAQMFKSQRWALESGKAADKASVNELASAFESIVGERGANIEQWREYFDAERQNAEVDKKRLIEQEENMERQAAIYFYESTEADLGEMIEMFIETNSVLTTIATLVDNIRGLFTEYKMKWQTYYLGSTESKVGSTSVIKDLLAGTKTNSGGLAQIAMNSVSDKLAAQYKQLEDAEKGITGFTYYEKRLNAGLGNGKSYYTKIQEIQAKEKGEKDDAVLALADALTANTVDLRDPQVQGNALLAEILKLVAALVNQNNSTVTNTALPSDIAALGTGTTNLISTAVNTAGALTGVNIPPIK